MLYDYSLSTITIQQIQIFLSVADSRNFTRSACDLNMTQPGISKSISALEQILGFSVFARTSRKVELTEEGMILYNKWKNVFRDIQNGYHEAKYFNDNRSSILNIGVVNTADANKFFWPLANKFFQKYPDISMNVESEDMKALQNNLADGNYDLIFVPDFEHYSLDKNHTPWKYIAKSNVQIIVLNTNPLSQKSELTINDILDCNAAALDPEVNPNFLLALEELYEPYGCSPNIVCFYKSNFQIRYAQKMQECIHITDDFWDYSQDEYSKKIPLKDHFNGIICAWNTGNKKDCLKKFLEFIPDIG